MKRDQWHLRLLVILGAGLLLAAVAAPRQAAAQEFNCTVSLDYSQLSGNDFQYLQELQQRLEEYMNNNRWTEDRYQDQERIDCTVQVTIMEAVTMTSFRARLVVASRRPIYNTLQYSTVVQFNDPDWQFSYVQGAPMTFDVEQYNPLTSVVDFYAYLMLGYDYDTFSEQGGTPLFEKARRIAELAQGQSAPGWQQVGSDRGRLNLITQILDARFQPLRTAYFNHHFKGLDHFVVDPPAARQNVLETLRTIEELIDQVSRQYAVDVYFSSKYGELAAIFDDSPLSDEAYTVLSTIDPAHMTEYNRLVE